MTETLVTGGAGFIGSYIVDRLVDDGYSVTVLDNLSEQVHTEKPAYLNDEATYVWEDVRNRDVLTDLLSQADVVSHQASVVGVGQSMYEVERYVDVNTGATARLLDIIVKEDIELEKLVVASSMSIYGEGEYYCESCEEVIHPPKRTTDQLQRKEWELRCPECGASLEPESTPEDKPLDSSSIYAITKKDQEEMTLTIGQAYDIPAVALRYFNVYGPRQSLDNPYTGVCAIFSSRIKNDNPPLLFEDGNQTRDFVHVSDIARANHAAIERDEANGHAINVGTGHARSIREIAETLVRLYGKDDSLDPEVVDEFREGDIRHCSADTSRANRLLGYEPEVDFGDGMGELVQWASEQRAEDNFDRVYGELTDKGLVER
jgi:dTDP-L-rhamnose 4-epimerase